MNDPTLLRAQLTHLRHYLQLLFALEPTAPRIRPQPTINNVTRVASGLERATTGATTGRPCANKSLSGAAYRAWIRWTVSIAASWCGVRS